MEMSSARTFFRKFRRTVLFGLKIITFVVMLALLYFFWIQYYGEAGFAKRGYLVYLLAYGVMFALFGRIYGAFGVGVSRLSELIFSLGISLFIADALAYLQLCLVGRQILDPLPIFYLFLTQVIFGAAMSMVANRVYFYLYPARKVLFIYKDEKKGARLMGKVMGRRERYEIDKVMTQSEGFDTIVASLDEHRSLILCDLDIEFRDRLIEYCFENRHRVYVVPSVQDIMMANSHRTQIFDTPMFLIKNSGLTTEQEIFKRFTDILFSLILFIPALPIMLLAALAIKIDDRGPVFYTQDRVTRGGRVFKMYKFRSMIVDAEKGDQILVASKNDSRITRVGKFIRKTRVDELPQLWNILKGDMSFVGPRAHRPEHYEMLEREMPSFKYRLAVKAGLTGLAQIYGKYNTSLKDKLRFDLIYILEYSMIQDIKLILSTVKVVFMPDSTEGVDGEAGGEFDDFVAEDKGSETDV